MQCKLEPDLAKRAEHYFSENMRVMKGVEAWETGSLEDFGILIAASGRSSIQNYECGMSFNPQSSKLIYSEIPSSCLSVMKMS